MGRHLLTVSHCTRPAPSQYIERKPSGKMFRLSISPLLLLLIISHTMARSPAYQVNLCLGKACGTYCSTGDNPDGICDGNDYCTDPLFNPCSHHGCGCLRSGDECLQG